MDIILPYSCVNIRFIKETIFSENTLRKFLDDEELFIKHQD